MSQFVVSARKYRPQRFDEVVGQEHVSKTLKNALQNDQLAHAFLFCGPRGVGKTTCARILAKVLNCENRTADFEACNTCNSCTAFNSSASFNINELDAASNNSVDHIRALIEQVRFQPQQGQYKIFIIDEVHMLSQQAFNAFLKTLEEPPPYAIFILATTEKHKIIPTILSRCQIFDFKRIQISRIVSHLEHICKSEDIKGDKEALHIIAQKADGALRDALSIFDRMSSFAGGQITYDSVIENLNILDYDYYFRVVDAMITEDVAGVLMIFDEIFKKGFDPDIFINGLAEHLRNLLVCKDAKTLNLLAISDTLKKRYQEQASIVPSSFILTALSIASDCDVNYKMARHKRLHVEMAIIKMTYIGRAVELASKPAAVATEEKKTPELNTRTSPAPIATQSAPNAAAIPAAKVIAPPVQTAQQAAIPATPTANTPPTAQEGVPQPVTKELIAESTNSKVEEPKPVPATVNPGSLKRVKSSKFDLPSLKNLTAIEEESASIPVKIPDLEIEQLTNFWEEYIMMVESPSAQTSFRSAEISVKDKQTILIEVGSKMAKSLIQQESNLVPYLRKELNIPKLGMEILIDQSKAKEILVTKKLLSTKEKYEMMRDKNPLVQDLSARLGLKFDNS